MNKSTRTVGFLLSERPKSRGGNLRMCLGQDSGYTNDSLRLRSGQAAQPTK